MHSQFLICVGFVSFFSSPMILLALGALQAGDVKFLLLVVNIHALGPLCLFAWEEDGSGPIHHSTLFAISVLRICSSFLL